MDIAGIIRHEFLSCATETIKRLEDEPGKMPFHEALLSKEALFWSRFERSFSTSFGQRTIERLSAKIALYSGATNVIPQNLVSFNIDSDIHNAVIHHLSALRRKNSGAVTNWQEELNYFRSIQSSGNVVNVTIRSDLYYIRDNTHHFYSIKTVKPNIDQTVEAKKDLLLLSLAYPNSKAYFGLYYNPYGEFREQYIWAPPRRIFNFHTDESVLIGKDYWDNLGGNGTYEFIMEIAQEVGPEIQELIRQYGIRNL